MIGLLKRATLTPAEELENDKLIKEIQERRNPEQIGKEWRVVLDHYNPTSAEEYPDQWVGIEIERGTDHILLRFPQAFKGKAEKGHGEVKTKKHGQHRYTLWVPMWLLSDFRTEVSHE